VSRAALAVLSPTLVVYAPASGTKADLHYLQTALADAAADLGIRVLVVPGPADVVSLVDWPGIAEAAERVSEAIALRLSEGPP